MALAAAMLWAMSTVIFSRMNNHISALELNLFKALVAMGLFGLTLLITRQIAGDLPITAAMLFLASGAIGIGLGDTAYFNALYSIGPQKASLLKTSAPPLVAILGLLLLNEQLGWKSWLGIALVMAGVVWVISERPSNGENADVKSGLPLRGIVFGFLAAITEAIGVILSHIALTQSNITPLLGSSLRLVGAALIIVIIVLIKRQKLGAWMKKSNALRVGGTASLAVFAGTFLGIWLQQSALKLTAAGIVQTLIATTPIFVLPISALIGQKVTPRIFIGVAIALVGVFFVFNPG